MEGRAWAIVGDKKYDLGNIKNLAVGVEVKIPDTVEIGIPVYTWRLHSLAKDFYSRAEAFEAFKRHKALCDANAKQAVQAYREKVRKCKT